MDKDTARQLAQLLNLTKHQTLLGRRGDPRAPGDPEVYPFVTPPHKERGGVGRNEKLDSQWRHNVALGIGKQRMMIALRAVAKERPDLDIEKFLDMEGSNFADVRKEFERLFEEFEDEDVLEAFYNAFPKASKRVPNIDEVDIDSLMGFLRAEFQ